MIKYVLCIIFFCSSCSLYYLDHASEKSNAKKQINLMIYIESVLNTRKVKLITNFEVDGIELDVLIDGQRCGTSRSVIYAGDSVDMSCLFDKRGLDQIKRVEVSTGLLVKEKFTCEHDENKSNKDEVFYSCVIR